MRDGTLEALSGPCQRRHCAQTFFKDIGEDSLHPADANDRRRHRIAAHIGEKGGRYEGRNVHRFDPCARYVHGLFISRPDSPCKKKASWQE